MIKKANRRKGSRFFNHGRIEIDRSEARQALGEPHFIETDQYRTAGGEEDHWLFEYEDGIQIFFNLRVPYGHLDLNFSHKEKIDMETRLPKELLRFKMEEYEESYELL